VKNGAELLDRLVKDIVAESAASYVSILHTPHEEHGIGDGEGDPDDEGQPAADHPKAFSLERFLPLLEERINVLNPFTRTFLVAWITLLDSIPDLELVTHLPRFLRGLFKFLSDPNQDVKTATHKILERFLNEMRSIAGVKRGVAESRKSMGEDGAKHSISSMRSAGDDESDVDSLFPDQRAAGDKDDDESAITASTEADEEKSIRADDDWIPGQDVQVDHAKILDILVSFLGEPPGKAFRSSIGHHSNNLC
jgi:vacuole morphology and inheritance protein 14